jgi:hypothetical protein
VKKICTFILVVIFLALSACQSTRFLNQDAQDFQRLACVVEKESCGVHWESGDYIYYDVRQNENGSYRVDGTAHVHWISKGVSEYITFYILFMDDSNVVYEKRIKTRRKASFSFDFELSGKSVVTSSLHKIQFWERT